MKFIHTSDWHLGRYYKNVSLLDDQKVVLQQIKSQCQKHSVDALIIAGDIYDRSVPPASAVTVLSDFLDEVLALGINVIMITGNHDSAERFNFATNQLKNSGLFILNDISNVCEPVSLSANGLNVDFYGIPFHDPVNVREAYDCDVKSYDEAHTFLAERIKHTRDTNRKAVLLSHCFIDGAEESESERPIGLGGAERVAYQPLIDFDYVALGHLHGPQYRGKEHIRYSGSPLKYSFSEVNQKKSVTLVEVGDNVKLELLPLFPKHDVRVLEGTLEELLQQGQNDVKADDYISARLTDSKDLLDPMARLRAVYPNILELERTNFIRQREKSNQLTDIKSERAEYDVFADFFKEVTGDDLSDEQMKVVKDVVQLVRERQGENA